MLLDVGESELDVGDVGACELDVGDVCLFQPCCTHCQLSLFVAGSSEVAIFTVFA
jgi:hypothetical protein